MSPNRGRTMSSDDKDLRRSFLDPNEHAEVAVQRLGFIKESFRKSCKRCQCSKDCFLSFLYRIFPFIGIMKDHSIRTDLTGDIVSGLTVGIMHIPQAAIREMLEKTGFFSCLDRHNLFVTVHDAVLHALHQKANGDVDYDTPAALQTPQL